ncbi:MAG: hypothetical protein DMF54_11385 [Acidobacteria bacterium]|nr:MAG: hypothetical protein DMF55_02860 [Acidobacteriota bacterium]PYQ65332.1 MAG: hypothetical protein DMF54_11385 [Acidobacteriota bacterium]
MPNPPHSPQRTGWVILVLMTATNFLPWMEPLMGETLSFDLVAPARVRMSMGACLIAAALVAFTWLAGRHATTPLPRRIGRPRLLGFRIALVSAAVNVLLGSTVAAFGSHASFAGAPLGVVVGVLWFALVLPAEVVSSYLTGRGSATRRIAAVANAAVTGA